MTVQIFPSGPIFTNAYLVVCPETGLTAIVDPAPKSADKLISYITKHSLKPDKILLTHSHWDHIADAAQLQNHYNLPIYVHPEDKGNVEEPGSDGLPTKNIIPPAKVTHLIHDGEKIEVGTVQLIVLHTPGHTPGGVCFYCPEHHFLLSGDTLFRGTFGNLSFSTGRPHLMQSSLKKLLDLPAQTMVYPGHGESTSIGAESWLKNAKIKM